MKKKKWTFRTFAGSAVSFVNATHSRRGTPGAHLLLPRRTRPGERGTIHRPDVVDGATKLTLGSCAAGWRGGRREETRGRTPRRPRAARSAQRADRLGRGAVATARGGGTAAATTTLDRRRNVRALRRKNAGAEKDRRCRADAGTVPVRSTSRDSQTCPPHCWSSER